MFKRDYRIRNRDALAFEDGRLAGEVVTPIWGFPTPDDDSAELPRKWRRVTKGQLLVYAVTWLEREVINGGFAQYFWNPAGSYYRHCLAGLIDFGLQPLHDLLTRACSVFPDGQPSLVRNERIRFLTELAKQHESEVEYVDDELTTLEQTVFDDLDSRFYELHGEGEDYYRAMAQYIRIHPDEFIR